MRLSNFRCGWTVQGDFVTIIDAGKVPTDDEMLAYWHLKPGDARFAMHAKAFKYARCVLLKPNSNFVITPLTPDIKEVTA